MHGLLLRMEEILAYCVAMEDHIVSIQNDMQLLVGSVCTLVSAMEDALLQNSRARARGSGRPPLCISEDHICYLFQNDFSLVDMAHMLCVSSQYSRTAKQVQGRMEPSQNAHSPQQDTNATMDNGTH